MNDRTKSEFAADRLEKYLKEKNIAVDSGFFASSSVVLNHRVRL
jgi:hypothetical protein